MNKEQNTDHVSDSGKKVSSIDWFIDEGHKLITQLENEEIRITAYFIMQHNLIKQAREMHKQDIIDAYHINPLEAKWQNKGIEYYNETFKQ